MNSSTFHKSWQSKDTVQAVSSANSLFSPIILTAFTNAVEQTCYPLLTSRLRVQHKANSNLSELIHEQQLSPTTRSFLAANNEKQVSRPSHVCFAQDAMRNSGQACRCCSSAPRVRLPLLWLPRWMLQKRPSEAENHHGMRNRELLGGWEGCCHTERRRAAANHGQGCNDA